jgi:hypothetical protein
MASRTAPCVRKLASKLRADEVATLAVLQLRGAKGTRAKKAA